MPDPFGLLNSNIYEDGLWWERLTEEERQSRRAIHDLVMTELTEEVNLQTNDFTSINCSKPSNDTESKEVINKKTRSTKNRAVNIMQFDYQRYESNEIVNSNDLDIYPSINYFLSDRNFYRIMFSSFFEVTRAKNWFKNFDRKNLPLLSRLSKGSSAFMTTSIDLRYAIICDDYQLHEQIEIDKFINPMKNANLVIKTKTLLKDLHMTLNQSKSKKIDTLAINQIFQHFTFERKSSTFTTDRISRHSTLEFNTLFESNSDLNIYSPFDITRDSSAASSIQEKSSAESREPVEFTSSSFTYTGIFTNI